MIIKFFSSGTSNGSAPINYLLSSKDHEKRERAVKPEVLTGDSFLTKELIDSLQNKWKYTSGVFAFRENENPNNKELRSMLKDFLSTMAPGMEDRLNLFSVIHRDKGRLEVHFIVPRVDLETGKAFNIAPPGQNTKRLTELFRNQCNEKFGFQDVIQDVFKPSIKHSEILFQKFKSQKDLKSWAQKFSATLYSKGLINNREDLTKKLSEAGFEITRKGADYISIKHPKMQKAVRLKGLAYSENTDYKVLFGNFKQKTSNYFAEVSDSDKKELKNLVSQRKAYNTHTYTYRTRMDSLKSVKSSPILKKTKKGKFIAAPINSSMVSGISTAGTAVQDLSQNGNVKNAGSSQQEKQEQSKDNSSGTPMHTGSISSNIEALNGQLSSIESQIIGLSGQLNHAKTPGERAKIQIQLARLQAQREAVISRLKDAGQQNANQGRSFKPK